MLFNVKVIIVKLLIWFIRIFNFGNGTSLPGYFIEKTGLDILYKINKDLQRVILITGTNGKTTTRGLINHIFTKNNTLVVSNLSGANLIRGILTSLLNNYTFFADIKAKIAVLEVEEASLPILTKYLKADYIIFTNIFRDQLDAYGEIDKTLEYFSQSLLNSGISYTDNYYHKTILNNKKRINNLQLKDEKHPISPVIIANGDDNRLLECLYRHNIEKLYLFEIDSNFKPEYENSSKIENKSNFIGLKKIYKAKNIIENLEGLNFEIEINNLEKNTKNSNIIDLKSLLVGNYNVYNILASGILTDIFFGNKIWKQIADYSGVFGRGERIKINGNQNQIQLFLVKNPVGFNEVCKLIQNSKLEKTNLCITINDNIADGRDVSWLWDIQLEKFLTKVKLQDLVCSGTRGLDMLLRLEYFGLKVSPKLYEPNTEILTQYLIDTKENWIVLATYTAMLDFRQKISKFAKLKNIYDKNF